MSLTLHFHPLSSFCWKVLIALYENATPFTPLIVDLGDPDSRDAFLKLWPIGKFPVLHDRRNGETIPESSIIIEYLAARYPGPADLVLAGDEARQVRFIDRFYDLYVHEPMQKVVGDRLRPDGQTDPFGVEQARSRIRTSYAILEKQMAARRWAAGPTFTMADCAATPALFYANKVEPIGSEYAELSRYHERLLQRPSVARVIREAQPYFRFFPYNDG